MKKQIFLKTAAVAVLAFSALFAHAQISVGAKGGVNVSNLNGIDANNYDTKAMVGFHLGGYVTFNLGRNFAIQPELVYSSQGGTIESGSIANDVKLNYFNVPVMVKFLTNSGFYLEAGPQLGFKAGEKFDDLESSVKGSDLSICGGIGFQPTKSAFGIGARYNAGMGTAGSLEGLPSTDDVDYKNGVFQLSLYWRIFGGGKLKD